MFFTRDLVNEPANVLTTSDFADRLLAMRELGLEVEVLDEETWEVPASLSEDDWRGMADGRRDGPLEGEEETW